MMAYDLGTPNGPSAWFMGLFRMPQHPLVEYITVFETETFILRFAPETASGIHLLLCSSISVLPTQQFIHLPFYALTLFLDKQSQV
jgi:hypothetical protein